MLKTLWWNVVYAWYRWDESYWNRMERSARVGKMLIETED